MTPRERSILVGGAALVCALLAVFIGVQALMGGESTESLDGGQFVENATGDLALPTTVTAAAAQTALVTTASTVGSTLPSPSSSETTTPTLATTSSVAPPTTAATTPTIAETTPTVEESTTTPTVEATTTTVASTSSAPTTVASTAPPSGHHPIELEIYRLTNELRANPSGPLARQKAMPECVSEAFYGITIDQNTGHPTAVPALGLNEAVSINLARDWSVKMDASGNFGHRPNSEATTIYSQLGIRWSAIGENIAWFSGYSDAEAAQVFFNGWRESDTGHYCALMAGTFTNIGVGYHKGATRSWATQNFYGT